MVTLTLSFRGFTLTSPESLPPSEESRDIEEEAPHPRQQAQHELPPPPSLSLGPPASLSATSSSSISQRPCYPFGFVLFLDPSSRRAQHLYEDPLTSTSGESLVFTKVLSEATHVIVGTSSFGEAVASQETARQPSVPGLDASAGEGGRLFFLVNLPWIVKSIKNNVWENEEEYLFVSVGERVVEDLETAPEEMTSVEEESLARFLAALEIGVEPSGQDEDGMDSFDRYLVDNESNERSANELRTHYHLRRETFFDHRIWIMRREAAALEPYLRTERRRIKTRLDTEFEVSKDDEFEQDPEGRTSRAREKLEVESRASSYTLSEERDLSRCIQQSSSVTEAAQQFSKMHPSRTLSSAINYYSRHPAKFGDPGRRVAFSAGQDPRTDLRTASEDQQLIELIATRSEGPISSAIHTFIQKNPRRSYSATQRHYASYKAQFEAAIQQFQDSKPSASSQNSSSRSNSKPSSSFTTSLSFGGPPSHFTATSASSPSSSPPTIVASTQKRVLVQPSTSSSSKKKVRFEDPVASKPRSNPFQRDAPIAAPFSFLLPSHQSPSQKPNPPFPHLASPKASRPSSSFSKSRQLEPATNRSSVEPSSRSCSFCWEDGAPFYSILDLAERNFWDMNVFVRIPGGREACSSCVDWYERSLRLLAEGDVEGMSELERMAWATERLMKIGMEERKRFIGVEQA